MTESPATGDARALEQQAAALPVHALDAPGLAALELLLEGAFSPLRGFALDPAANGTPALPLPVGAGTAQAGTRLALHDSEGVTLAVLEVTQRGGSDAAPTVGGPLHGIRKPARELFLRHRLPVGAIRAALAASGRARGVLQLARGPGCARTRAHRAPRGRARGAAAGDGLRRCRSGAPAAPAAGCRAGPGRRAR